MTGPERTVAVYLDEVVRRVSTLAGDALVGLWAVGSVGLGAYEQGISDVDVAVAVERGLTADERRTLASGLSHRSLPCPARKLELVVYRRDVLERPAERLAFELNLNTGAGMPDRVTTEIADESPHWFLLDLAMARERCIALAGPPFADLIGPIPDEAVLAALRLSLDWFEANEPDRASVVLAACRAWRYASERRFGTKAEAAVWVARAEPAVAAVVDAAIAARRGRPADALREADVAGVVESARRALA